MYENINYYSSLSIDYSLSYYRLKVYFLFLQKWHVDYNYELSVSYKYYKIHLFSYDIYRL